ncbi:MAG: putative selenium-dependent hydroxylase accessory protein YqeC [Syntrophus sp. (in: bacteria)]|nr:putative selenium-dependent hydroxylase accessory protein YqeC [Syntrophus sp. (in: bacteria)]
MWHFQKIDIVKLLTDGKYITFVGGGGKSTFIEYIAQKASLKGKRVAVTTTTKIYAKEPYVCFDEGIGRNAVESGPVRIGKTREGEKLTGLSFHEVARLGELFDMVLVEADGAKGKPLKYPADHEPVIPPFSDIVFVVAGLDALHGRVDTCVFRWEFFCAATGVSRDADINPDLFLRFFTDTMLLKGVEREKCIVILNKYDIMKKRNEAARLAKGIVERTGCREAILSTVFYNLFYRVTKVDG